MPLQRIAPARLSPNACRGHSASPRQRRSSTARDRRDDLAPCVSGGPNASTERVRRGTAIRRSRARGLGSYRAAASVGGACYGVRVIARRRARSGTRRPGRVCAISGQSSSSPIACAGYGITSMTRRRWSGRVLSATIIGHHPRATSAGYRTAGAPSTRRDYRASCTLTSSPSKPEIQPTRPRDPRGRPSLCRSVGGGFTVRVGGGGGFVGYRG